MSLALPPANCGARLAINDASLTTDTPSLTRFNVAAGEACVRLGLRSDEAVAIGTNAMCLMHRVFRFYDRFVRTRPESDAGFASCYKSVDSVGLAYYVNQGL